KTKHILYISQAAMIAAVYVVLTYLINSINLASGAIQIRFSEALTILPFFTPAAIPGLFVGCILANTLTGCALWDIIFGSLATLIGALGTYLLRKHSAFLLPIPPILANTIIVPFVLRYVYEIPGAIPFLMLTVGIGEVLSCGVLGLLLHRILLPYKGRLFAADEASVSPLSDQQNI
nr:QueT transporter family protein [Lachnospiraceae bacterium]